MGARAVLPGPAAGGEQQRTFLWPLFRQAVEPVDKRLELGGIAAVIYRAGQHNSICLLQFLIEGLHIVFLYAEGVIVAAEIAAKTARNFWRADGEELPTCAPISSCAFGAVPQQGAGVAAVRRWLKLLEFFRHNKLLSFIWIWRVCP